MNSQTLNVSKIGSDDPLAKAFPLLTSLCFGEQTVIGENLGIGAILIFPFQPFYKHLYEAQLIYVMQYCNPALVFNANDLYSTRSRAIKWGNNGSEFFSEIEPRIRLVKKIVFIAEWWRCGWCRLVLQKYFPQAEIFQQGVASSLPEGQGVIEPGLWDSVPLFIKLIWNEYKRIVFSESQHEICCPEGVRQTIEDVHNLLGEDWELLEKKD